MRSFLLLALLALAGCSKPLTADQMYSVAKACERVGLQVYIRNASTNIICLAKEDN